MLSLMEDMMLIYRLEQKQLKIDAANAEVAEISQAYANGYLERSNQNDGWYVKLQEYNKKTCSKENEAITNMYIPVISWNMKISCYNKNQCSKNPGDTHQLYLILFH